MATEQATAEGAAAAESTAKDESVLTADTTTKGTTQAPSAPSATSSLPHAWMNGLTTEQKANADLIKGLSQFEKGIPDLVGYFASAEGAKGKTVAVPSEGATKEEWAAFRKAIGVPEKPEDYKLEAVKLPNEEKLDPAWEKDLRALAQKINLSQGQLAELHKWYFGGLAEAMRFVKTTAKEAHAVLRKEMGADYDIAMTAKTRAVKKFFDDELAVLFERTGLGNHPRVLKMFAAIGKELGDHVFAEGSRGEKTETGIAGARTDAQLAELLYGKK